MERIPNENHPRRWRLVVLGAACALAPSACGLAGSGDIVTESRSVASFTGIEVSSGVNVELTVDPNASQSVSVTYDDNLLDRVTTSVEGSTLVIRQRDTRIIGGGRFVTVITDSIELIEASGGADVTGTGVIDTYRVEASGGADVDLRDVEASTVEVDASGGADVWVFATDSISVDASGGSDVSVSGNPARTDISESGGADVDIRG